MSNDGWRVAFTPGAGKEIDHLDPPVRRRVVKAIRRLAENPHSGSLKKLRGRPESRLRVGDWRVLVQLDTDTRTILVKHILPRGRAYER